VPLLEKKEVMHNVFILKEVIKIIFRISNTSVYIM